MCPLRVLLIFLSATVAGFFVLRSLKSEPEDGFDQADDAAADEKSTAAGPKEHVPLPTKVGSAICAVFWTLVDMASGKYLWRTLVSPASTNSSDKKL
ncbi:uncharacterized protein [Typha latifolia]|uniref:uncharacterized protein n=1 Tax=Typha latifolia TaxID=4733 RepID=UPI003C2F2DF5